MLKPLDPGLKWAPSVALKPVKQPPGTNYALAVVDSDTVGYTRRGEIYYGVVAGHFKMPFSRVMRFQDAIRYVYPMVEYERLEAYRHASALGPSYARGYLLECHDGNLEMMSHIEKRLNEFPLERVAFLTDCAFKDPLEKFDRSGLEVEPLADVVSIKEWLAKRPGQAVWHKALQQSCSK